MKLKNTRSYTLIEALVAIGLGALIVITLVSSVIAAFDNLRRVAELRTASLILQERVSMVRDLKFSDIQSLSNTFSPSGMVFLRNAAGTITKSPYNGQSNMLKVTFILDWTSFNGHAMQKTLVTLMTDHGINKQ